MTWKDYLKRLKNPATVMSIASAILMILVNFGIEVDSEAITGTVNSICSILIVVGIMNNPDTKGMR